MAPSSFRPCSRLEVRTLRPEGTFPLPFRSENLSDLRGEKQGKRHVANLVLQLLDPVDMCILILENVFQYLPRGKVINFSGELDGLIVGFDGTQLEGGVR